VTRPPLGKDQHCLPPRLKDSLIQRLRGIFYPHLRDIDRAVSPDRWLPLESEESHSNSGRAVELENVRIRACFVDLFLALFEGYQECTGMVRKYPTPIVLFNKAKFFKRHRDYKVRSFELILWVVKSF
jgi:hypothetical protein